MNDERDDAFEELETLLRVDPSPGFVSRVTAQAETSANRRRARGRLWLVACSACAVVALGLAWFFRTPPASTVVRVNVQVKRPPAVTAPIARAVVSSESAVATSRRRGPRSTLPSKPREPEVLISVADVAAFYQWLEGVREGRAVVPPPVGDEAIVIPELPPIEPIRSQPVTIVALQADDDVNKGERQ